MKPPRFEYRDPRTVAEAVALLQQADGDAKILAGGQSLMPLLSMRLSRPAMLVDINKVADLDYIRESGGVIAIGAMTRKRAVEDSELVRTRQPLLYDATALVGHRAIRNRGTVGGSIAQADPAAEYPAVAVALDAEMEAHGPKGSRTIRAADFFVTYLTTALEPSEVLTEVRFPMFGPNTGWSILEVSRRHGDFAMAGAAVTVRLDDKGACDAARVVVFGVGASPIRGRKAEQMLVGRKPEEPLLERAGEAVNDEIEEPLSDIHASADYRRHLAQVLTRRALAEAAARVQGRR